MNREIQISSKVAIVLSLVLIDVIFLAYLGYDWYSGYHFDPSGQNTEEANTALKGTAFVLGILLIALYKVLRKEKFKNGQRDNIPTPPHNVNTSVNTVANIVLVATGIFFGICILIYFFYALLFMYGTPS